MPNPYQASSEESGTSDMDALTDRAEGQGSRLRDRSPDRSGRERGQGRGRLPAPAKLAAPCPSCGHQDRDPEGLRWAPAPPEARHVGNGPRTATERLTLSVSEAAQLLGIGVSTAYRLCSRGEFPIPVLRIGGVVKVSSQRLRDYVEAGDEGAEA